MSSTMDPAKLKVVDLRQELSQRGLDTKGNKAALVKRLKDALEGELKQDLPDTSIADTSTEDFDTSQSEETESRKENKPAKEVRTEEESESKVKSPKKEALKPDARSPSKSLEKIPKVEPVKEVVKDVKIKPQESKSIEKPAAKPVESEVKSDTIPEENGDHVVEEQSEERPSEEKDDSLKEDQDDTETDQNEEEKPQDEKMEDDSADTKGEKRKRDGESPDRSQKRRERSPIREDEPEIDNDKPQLSWYDSDLHLQVDKQSFLSAKPINEGAFGYIWAGARATHGVSSGKICYEVKLTEELKWEDLAKYYPERRDRERDRYRTDHRRDNRDRGRDRKDSEKKSGEKPKSEKVDKEEKGEKTEDTEKMETDGEAKEDKSEDSQEEKEESKKVEEKTEEKNEEEKIEDEEEKREEEEKKEEEKKEEVDLTQDEDKEKEEREPDSDKKDEKMETDEEKKEEKAKEEEPKKEPIPTHFFRVGFSMLSTNLQLGESKHSFGYDSSAKFVTNKQFEDYGITFGVGDVVGAYLSIDENEVTITYTVNGAVQSTAIAVSRSEFPEENFALFPHVLSRNYAFELNFGTKEEPWFPAPEELQGYQFLEAAEAKVAGPRRPETRAECEIILMVGLPGSGKSHWIDQHLESNTDKEYTIIGNSTLFDRMTVSGEPLRSRFAGSWKILVDKLQKSLNKMTDIASVRRRNYIINQTNLFPSAQRRKMRTFEGFKRRAVCVVVGDEEQARRLKQQETQDGKDVPESMMLELKATMELPDKCDWLDEILYPELEEEEAKKAVKKFNEDAHKQGYSRRFPRRDYRRPYYPHGNYRDRSYGDGRHDRYNQGGWNRSGGGGGGGWNRDRRDNRAPQPRQGGGGWRQGGPGNRSQDRSREGPRPGGGYAGGRNQGRNGGGWQSGGGWGGGGGGHGGWNQQVFGSHGYGSWNQQGQGGWKYGQGQGQGGYGNQGAGGYGQSWNYYGQYGNQQGWGNSGGQQKKN